MAMVGCEIKRSPCNGIIRARRTITISTCALALLKIVRLYNEKYAKTMEMMRMMGEERRGRGGGGGWREGGELQE